MPRTLLPRLVLAVLAVAILSGCALMRPDPPDVQLAGLGISDLSLTHVNFLANVSLYNPNSTALDVEGLEFALYLDEIRIARGMTARAFSIPAEQTGNADLRLSTSFFDLFRLSRRIRGMSEIPFRMAGEIKVGGPGFLWMTLPVDSEGTIPLAGALGEIFSAPDEFWQQPGRLVPEKTLAPAPSLPSAR